MRIKIKAISIAVFFCCMGTSLMAQFSTQQEPDRYEENKIYVKYKNTSKVKVKSGPSRMIHVSQLSQLQKRAQVFGIHSEAMSMSFLGDEDLQNTVKVEFDSIQKMDLLIEELQQDPHVEYVEKIPMYRLFSATNDPYATVLGGRNLRWHLDIINAEEAWAKQTASPNIKVSIVDGAVWGEHEDLQIKPENQYDANKKTVGSSAPSIPINVDKDCLNLASCVAYTWSHGTHCAGLVGAINNNGKGISSIGGGVTLMSVSAEDWGGMYTTSSFDGIIWSIENGAKVLSCSWGSNSISRTHSNILKAAYKKGIIMIFASGNYGSSRETFPASSPYVISVGSINSDRGPSSFSNYGSWVDIAAPGGLEVDEHGNEGLNEILSTTFCRNQNYRLNEYSELNGTFYDGMAGTSMATPMVAGLAGLLLSKDSILNMSMLKTILMSSGQAVFYGRSGKFFNSEASVIDAKAALDYMDRAKVFPSSIRAVVSNKNTVNITWAPPTQKEEQPVRYKVYINRELADEHITSLSFSDLEREEGEYLYEIQAVYADGFESLKDGVCVSLVEDMYTVNVEVQPAGAGAIENTGDFPVNEPVEIKAHANPGYSFVQWKSNDKVLSTDAVFSILLDKDTSLVAEFRRDVSNQMTNEKTSLSVIPNPATQNIEILSEEDHFDQISILNTFGLEVMIIKQPQTKTLSVENLPRGIYFLKTINGNSFRLTKFIKQ